MSSAHREVVLSGDACLPVGGLGPPPDLPMRSVAGLEEGRWGTEVKIGHAWPGMERVLVLVSHTPWGGEDH